MILLKIKGCEHGVDVKLGGLPLREEVDFILSSANSGANSQHRYNAYNAYKQMASRLVPVSYSPVHGSEPSPGPGRGMIDSID